MSVGDTSCGCCHGSAAEEDKSDQPERITVLATEFEPAAMEFHRQRLGRLGYAIEGQITRHKFYMASSTGETTEMLDGKLYYAATFARRPGN